MFEKEVIPTQYVIVKLDSNGQFVESKITQGNLRTIVSDIHTFENKKRIVAGSKGEHGFIVQIDENYQVEWEKRYKFNFNQNVNYLILNRKIYIVDSTLVVHSEYGFGQLLSGFDFTGNLLWSKNITYSKGTVDFRIVESKQMKNGDITMVFNVNYGYQTNYKYAVYIVRLNSVGNVLLSKLIDTPLPFRLEAKSFVENSKNDGIIIAGEVTRKSNENIVSTYNCLIELSSNGDLTQNYTFKSQTHDFVELNLSINNLINEDTATVVVLNANKNFAFFRIKHNLSVLDLIDYGKPPVNFLIFSSTNYQQSKKKVHQKLLLTGLTKCGENEYSALNIRNNLYKGACHNLLPNITLEDTALIYRTDDSLYVTNANLILEINFPPVFIDYKQPEFQDLCEGCKALSAHSNNLKNNFKIYPNPSNGIFFIEDETHFDKLEWNLYNIKGQFILRGILDTSNNLDFSNLQNGVYLLNIKNQFYKIVITH